MACPGSASMHETHQQAAESELNSVLHGSLQALLSQQAYVLTVVLSLLSDFAEVQLEKQENETFC